MAVAPAFRVCRKLIIYITNTLVVQIIKILIPSVSIPRMQNRVLHSTFVNFLFVQYGIYSDEGMVKGCIIYVLGFIFSDPCITVKA